MHTAKIMLEQICLLPFNMQFLLFLLDFMQVIKFKAIGKVQ